MDKFNFRLDKVLDYRTKIEEVKKIEFGNAKIRLDKEMSIFNNMIDHKNKINSERNQVISKTTINELKNYNDYLFKIKDKLMEQKISVKKAQDDTQLAREKLVDSSKNKKILENLKDRDYKKYLYNIKREEDKIIDQIVSYKSSVK